MSNVRLRGVFTSHKNIVINGLLFFVVRSLVGMYVHTIVLCVAEGESVYVQYVGS